MHHVFQSVASVEIPAHGPIELSFEQLRQVTGGVGPNDNWGTNAVSGPNDSWATAAKGPNDNWA